MTKLVVDNALRNQLDNITVPVELCDESGRKLGHFLPAKISWEQFQRSLDQCPYSDEELSAMQQQSGGRSLTKVLEDLGRK